MESHRRTDNSVHDVLLWRDKLGIHVVDFYKKNLFLFLSFFLLILWLGLSYVILGAEQSVPGSNIHTYGDALWYGLVTILTVGYGDRYPIGLEGRILASLLMVSGVATMGIMTAKVAAIFLQQSILRGRGLVETKKLNRHFIICGWKEEMADLLDHVLHFNSDLAVDEIVLIAALSSAMVAEMRGHKKFGAIKIIAGSHFHQSVLMQAAPERARRILILADRTPHESGQIPTAQEADARTIMAANTLHKIAGHALITAEIVDRNLEEHLKMAGVSEIIFSREYSRLLLGNASGGTGITNILYDLLDPTSENFIATKSIPEALAGLLYGELKSRFEKDHPRMLVIGIMENTGNPYHLRERAIREAQKTSDVHKLVKNLSGVKEIRWNHPIFNPESGGAVGSGSMLIVIEKNRKLARNIA
jgi:voltage-gated potassium channel